MKGDKLPRGARAVLARFHHAKTAAWKAEADYATAVEWTRAAAALEELARECAKRESRDKQGG